MVEPRRRHGLLVFTLTAAMVGSVSGISVTLSSFTTGGTGYTGLETVTVTWQFEGSETPTSTVWINLMTLNGEPACGYPGYTQVNVQGGSAVLQTEVSSSPFSWSIPNHAYDSAESYFVQVSTWQRLADTDCVGGALNGAYGVSPAFTLIADTSGAEQFIWPPASETVAVNLGGSYVVEVSGLRGPVLSPPHVYAYYLVVEASISNFVNCVDRVTCWYAWKCGVHEDGVHPWLHIGEFLTSNNSAWMSWTLDTNTQACGGPLIGGTEGEAVPRYSDVNNPVPANIIGNVSWTDPDVVLKVTVAMIDNTTQTFTCIDRNGDGVCSGENSLFGSSTFRVLNTASPTHSPTRFPTTAPTVAPTATPTRSPSARPTATPTTNPTAVPTTAPSPQPTDAPTTSPTAVPTTAPSPQPTEAPTAVPTNGPTTTPTAGPSQSPTVHPSRAPTGAPTEGPTAAPTGGPTAQRSPNPSISPTAVPTAPTTASPTPSPSAPTRLVVTETSAPTAANLGSGGASSDSEAGFPWWIIVVVIVAILLLLICYLVATQRRKRGDTVVSKVASKYSIDRENPAYGSHGDPSVGHTSGGAVGNATYQGVNFTRGSGALGNDAYAAAHPTYADVAPNPPTRTAAVLGNPTYRPGEAPAEPLYGEALPTTHTRDAIANSVYASEKQPAGYEAPASPLIRQDTTTSAISHEDFRAPLNVRPEADGAGSAVEEPLYMDQPVNAHPPATQPTGESPYSVPTRFGRPTLPDSGTSPTTEHYAASTPAYLEGDVAGPTYMQAEPVDGEYMTAGDETNTPTPSARPSIAERRQGSTLPQSLAITPGVESIAFDEENAVFTPRAVGQAPVSPSAVSRTSLV